MQSSKVFLMQCAGYCIFFNVQTDCTRRSFTKNAMERLMRYLMDDSAKPQRSPVLCGEKKFRLTDYHYRLQKERG